MSMNDDNQGSTQHLSNNSNGTESSEYENEDSEFEDELHEHAFEEDGNENMNEDEYEDEADSEENGDDNMNEDDGGDGEDEEENGNEDEDENLDDTNEEFDEHNPKEVPITINGTSNIGDLDMHNISIEDVGRYDFLDLETAYEFYCQYAKMNGFSVRRSKLVRNVKGDKCNKHLFVLTKVTGKLMR